jgi:hypothetical protein
MMCFWGIFRLPLPWQKGLGQCKEEKRKAIVFSYGNLVLGCNLFKLSSVQNI